MDEACTYLGNFDTCVLSDALDRLGIPGVANGMDQLSVDAKVVGPVRTIQLTEASDGVQPRTHLGSAAILAAEEGDVIVVGGGRTDVGGWGGLLTFAAQQRGVAGVIVEGACRDIPEARAMRFPIYGRGCTPRSARTRLVEKETGGAVVIGGVVVNAGDYVVADASGVVFIPHERVARVLTTADEIATAEIGFLNELRAGVPINEVLDHRYEGLTGADGANVGDTSER